MKEYFRRNKALFRLLLGAAAFFGLTDWNTVHDLFVNLDSNLDLGGNVFSASWWLGEAWGVHGLRIFMAAIIIGTISNALFAFRMRNRPLSILCTDIVLQFSDGGAKVVTARKQLLHANRPDIAAYFMKFSLESANASFEQTQPGSVG
jgi:hypothetical protein